MAGNISINDLNAKMQQFQTQIADLSKLQQNIAVNASTSQTIAEQTPISTYPKVVRTDTVEDILENPQWKQELAFEFNSSELGIKAKNYTELLFMEFCEKQTGKPSTTLTEMRKNTSAQEKKSKTIPNPDKFVEDAKG